MSPAAKLSLAVALICWFDFGDWRFYRVGPFLDKLWTYVWRSLVVGLVAWLIFSVLFTVYPPR